MVTMLTVIISASRCCDNMYLHVLQPIVYCDRVGDMYCANYKNVSKVL